MTKTKLAPPFVISVMGSPYALRFVQNRQEMPHDDGDDDRESAGATDIYGRRIFLNGPELRAKGLGAESVCLHELIHACLAESGWSAHLQTLDPKEGLEEALVTSLENGLIGHVAFRDPALRALLRKKK